MFDERTTAPPGGGSVAVSVDASSNVHAFSPNIFGVAFGDAARTYSLLPAVNRAELGRPSPSAVVRALSQSEA